MTAAAEPQEKKKADAQKPPSELFKFSRWVHIGLGADECEAGEVGKCDDPRHFHAWCRLPNQFQHQDIRERALAAKARRIRQLRDPEADGHEILEADLSLLETADRELLVDELVGKDWWKRHLDALAEVNEREEFEHIERDRERLTELRELPEDKRPKDEFDELEKHIASHGEAVEAERNKLEQPTRDALEGLGVSELVDQIRQDRIASEASEVFMDVYSRWQWIAGTYTHSDPLNRQPTFANMDELVAAAPEVIETLRVTYRELETSLTRGLQGN